MMLFAQHDAPMADAGTGDLLLKLSMALIGLIVGAYHGVGLWHMLTRRSKKAEDDALNRLARQVEDMKERIDEMKNQHGEFVNRVELGRAVRSIHADHQKLEAYVLESAKQHAEAQKKLAEEVIERQHDLALTIAETKGEVGDRIRKEMEPFGRKVDELIRATARLEVMTRNGQTRKEGGGE